MHLKLKTTHFVTIPEGTFYYVYNVYYVASYESGNARTISTRTGRPFLRSGRAALSSGPPTADQLRQKATSPAHERTDRTPFVWEEFVCSLAGATGAGALWMLRWGGKASLIERSDFSSETSSRSTKLIWAGIRYIATATARCSNWKILHGLSVPSRTFGQNSKWFLELTREAHLLENNPSDNWVPGGAMSWFSGHPIWPPNIPIAHCAASRV